MFTSRSWIQGKGARGGVKWASEKAIEGDTLRVAGGVKGNATLPPSGGRDTYQLNIWKRALIKLRKMLIY